MTYLKNKWYIDNDKSIIRLYRMIPMTYRLLLFNLQYIDIHYNKNPNHLDCHS